MLKSDLILPFLGDLLTYFLKSSLCLRIQLCTSIQFNSVTQSCLTLFDPMDCSMPGFPVHHQLLEIAQTHVLRLEKEMATHSGILAYRIPWTEEPGRLQSIWSQILGHDLVTKTTSTTYGSHFFIHLSINGHLGYFHILA